MIFLDAPGRLISGHSNDASPAQIDTLRVGFRSGGSICATLRRAVRLEGRVRAAKTTGRGRREAWRGQMIAWRTRAESHSLTTTVPRKFAMRTASSIRKLVGQRRLQLQLLLITSAPFAAA